MDTARQCVSPRGQDGWDAGVLQQQRCKKNNNYFNVGISDYAKDFISVKFAVIYVMDWRKNRPVSRNLSFVFIRISGCSAFLVDPCEAKVNSKNGSVCVSARPSHLT